MKNVALLFWLLPFFGLSQQKEYNPYKRELVDSIHAKRLCIDYVGMSRFMSTKEAFDESQYVFTGKVSEIIRIEKKIKDLDMINPEGKLLEGETQDVFEYYYVLKVDKQFKGEQQNFIKIHSKTYSTISPLLILNKNYLIYAKEDEDVNVPYIYCAGNSCHIEYAESQLKELRKLITN